MTPESTPSPDSYQETPAQRRARRSLTMWVGLGSLVVLGLIAWLYWEPLWQWTKELWVLLARTRRRSASASKHTACGLRACSSYFRYSRYWLRRFPANWWERRAAMFSAGCPR
jgi:hypothetical protein